MRKTGEEQGVRWLQIMTAVLLGGALGLVLYIYSRGFGGFSQHRDLQRLAGGDLHGAAGHRGLCAGRVLRRRPDGEALRQPGPPGGIGGGRRLLPPAPRRRAALLPGDRLHRPGRPGAPVRLSVRWGSRRHPVRRTKAEAAQKVRGQGEHNEVEKIGCIRHRGTGELRKCDNRTYIACGDECCIHPVNSISSEGYSCQHKIL